ncbi:hypothetical protein DW68_020790 [Ectopseudomonas mendocina S5.2]|uniref:Uncharacterized protein n=1 Tax=Ectopseudomonas mendocina S5.2 TaxID=1225174 RepID=A0ABM5W1G4_ECTME|nr:hypothetical protein DW68_020790 [Pseudomonas mendocina S5.2]
MNSAFLRALFERKASRSLQPTTITIRDYFDNLDSGSLHRHYSAMISSKVIPHLNSMHPACTANQSKRTGIVRKSTNHLETLYIKPFKKLSSTSFIRLDLF